MQQATQETTIQQPLIKDKSPKPGGLVPKNLQAFVLVGLALVMVLIMAVTGHKRPPAPIAQAQTAVPNPLPLNTEKVSEFEKRIEDAERSSAPQAEAALLREQRKQLAGAGPAQPFPSSPYGTPVSSANPAGTYPPSAYASAAPQPAQEQSSADALRDERRKREYLSLFSDNVALTYRKDASATTSTNGNLQTATRNPFDSSPQDQLIAQAGAALARQDQLLAQMQQAGTVSQTPQSNRTAAHDQTASSGKQPPTEATRPENPATLREVGSTETKKHVLFQGTILESVLINRLDGSFSGPVECLISTDVYSHDRQHLLIPAGTKVLGEATEVETFGQARLAVAFHRLIMPDGYSVTLDQFHSPVGGLDQQGATALKDKVSNHYAKVFGASLALGVLGGAAQLGTGSLLDQTAADRIRQGFGVGMADAGEQVLNRFLNILPTVTIREGTRVKIYLSGDLLLPDYHDHNLPPNL
jgi:type IV secretory pathway VirB10-like protein